MTPNDDDAERAAASLFLAHLRRRLHDVVGIAASRSPVATADEMQTLLTIEVESALVEAKARTINDVLDDG